MRKRTETNRCIWHCSATPPSMDIGCCDIRRWHVEERCWSDIGYHRVIKRDGTIEKGRRLQNQGAHALDHNRDSIGVCLVGGIDEDGNSVMNFTEAQEQSMFELKAMIDRKYPDIEHLGHRDVSPDLDGDGVVEEHEWLKDCPCFDVRAVFASGTLFDSTIEVELEMEPELLVVEDDDADQNPDGLLGSFWHGRTDTD